MSVTCNKTANTKKLPTDLCRALGHRCSAENTGKSTSSFKVGTEASLKEIIDSLTVLLLKNWTDYDRPVIPFNTLTSTVAVRVQLSVKSAQMSKITNDGLTRSGTGCQDCIAQCLTSPPTQYRLYGRRFLQVERPNQQYQSTERSYKRQIKQRKQQKHTCRDNNAHIKRYAHIKHSKSPSLQ